jgi:hypothetical protein
MRGLPEAMRVYPIYANSFLVEMVQDDLALRSTIETIVAEYPRYG